MTGFYISFIFSSVLFGYLGDRYSRKTIISISLVFETIGMFIVTFSETYQMLYIGRLIIGFFQASFVTIAPTIVADMYDSMDRTKYLTIFSIAGPFGIGVCFGLSSFLNPILGWRNTTRIYAVMTGVFALVHAFVIPEYERGAAEKAANQDKENSEAEILKTGGSETVQKSSFLDDLFYMVKVKSYTLSNFAFASVSCVTECGMVYFVEILRRYFITLGQQETCAGDTKDYLIVKEFTENGESYQITGGGNFINCSEVNCGTCEFSQISTIFGGISVVMGIVGTVIGAILMKVGIEKYNIRSAGPFVVTGGCLISTIGIVFLMYFPGGFLLAWVYCCIIFMALSTSFGILADIIPRIIVPEKRSIANSLQNFVGRAIGGTFPPMLTGYIIDSYTESKTEGCINEFSKFELSMVESKASLMEIGDRWAERVKIECVSDEAYFQVQVDAILAGANLIPVYAGLAVVFWWLTGLFFVKDEDKCRADISKK